MDLRPRMELRQELSQRQIHQIGLEQLPPEYKVAELRAALDLMARLAKYDIVDIGAEHKELGKEMLESKVTFNDYHGCYYLSKEVLLNYFNYNHLQYVAANNSRLTVRFSTPFRKSCLDDLVSQDLAIQEKNKRKYICAQDGTKMIEAKGHFLNLMVKPEDKHYNLALDTIVELATKIHEDNALLTVPTISLNQYLLGFFLYIPDYLANKGYIKEILTNFSLCLDKKINTVLVNGQNFEADKFYHATAKNSKCHTVNQKFNKRHIEYFYSDEAGTLIIRFNADVDKRLLEMSLESPAQVSISSGPWVNLEELNQDGLARMQVAGQAKFRELPGTRLLRNTQYTSVNLAYAKEGKDCVIKLKNTERSLIRVKNSTIAIDPGLNILEQGIAFEIANALYAQMLLQTPYVARGNEKSGLHSDEREIIKEVDSKAEKYVRTGGKKLIYLAYAKILAQRDMLAETMDALKKIPEEESVEKIPLLEAVKKYKTSLVDALKATKQGIIKTDDAGNVYVQDFEKFMEDRK